jgi:ATP-dependent Clp protease ATP-binding subunit ClpA
MFERFTDHSRGAIVLAQQEARYLDHNYIGTEHLLAGLQCEEGGAAARALESAGITVDAVRGKIEALVGRGERPPSGHIPFTPGAKQCLEFSLRESLKLGHNHISTGHLLLGLISQDDSMAVQVLGGLGADLGQLHARVIQDIEDDPEDRGGFSPPPRSRRAQLSGAASGLLDTIDIRLSSIELHLGITRSGPDAGAESEAAESSEKPGELAELQAEADRSQAEAGRLRAEADRLRALLREHDIDPDAPGDASAAAG